MILAVLILNVLLLLYWVMNRVIQVTFDLLTPNQLRNQSFWEYRTRFTDYIEVGQNNFWGYSRTFLVDLLAYCFVIKVHCIFIFNRGVRIAHVRIQKMFVKCSFLKLNELFLMFYSGLFWRSKQIHQVDRRIANQTYAISTVPRVLLYKS